MIHTEEAARKKWCPMVRMGEGGHNRWSKSDDHVGTVGCECIASACMLWAPDATQVEFSVIPENAKAPTPPPGDGWYMGVSKDNKPAWCRITARTGRCGLVNLPR